MMVGLQTWARLTACSARPVMSAKTNLVDTTLCVHQVRPTAVMASANLVKRERAALLQFQATELTVLTVPLDPTHLYTVLIARFASQVMNAVLTQLGLLQDPNVQVVRTFKWEALQLAQVAQPITSALTPRLLHAAQFTSTPI